MDRFVGRVALVSGVSSGIGEKIAEELVRAGVVVVGVARREERLKELAAKLSNEKGKLHPLPADLSRPEEVRRVYQWVEDNLGAVSIVVNNAAVLSMIPIQDMDSISIEQMIQTNLTAVMLSCREAVLNMKKHDIKDGHIVNINSILGRKVLNSPAFSVSAYASTKHAISGLTEGLRYDINKLEGFLTRVTSISPGGVATEMIPSAVKKMIPDDVLLKAQDVANAVMYALSSPASVEIADITLKATKERN